MGVGDSIGSAGFGVIGGAGFGVIGGAGFGVTGGAGFGVTGGAGFGLTGGAGAWARANGSNLIHSAPAAHMLIDSPQRSFVFTVMSSITFRTKPTSRPSAPRLSAEKDLKAFRQKTRSSRLRWTKLMFSFLVFRWQERAATVGLEIRRHAPALYPSYLKTE